MGQKWDACVDCGCVKVNGQRKRPRCNPCAQKEAQNRPDVKAKRSASLAVTMKDKYSKALRWDACIDCGCVKVKGQRKSPRCNPCASKEAQNRSDVRAKMSASLAVAMNRQDVKDKCSKAQKKLWSDPEFREARSSAIRITLNQEHVKEKIRAKSKEAASRPEVREKLSAAMKELLNRPDIRIARSLQRGGDGDIARIDRMKLRIAEYRSSHLRAWSLAVRERDSYICQHCGESDRRRLHAHHIKPRAMFPDLAFEVDNGLTLCNSCHLKEHRKMQRERADS